MKFYDHLFNPWRGKDGTRVIAADAYWRKPLKWAKDRRTLLSILDGHQESFSDAEREAFNHRPRVFCASMGDVFEDRNELIEARTRLFGLIRGTPELDWLLLTKRPENAASMREDVDVGQSWPSNVWLGTSVATQADADRNIPLLLQIPAAVRFVSLEPQIESVDLCHIQHNGEVEINALTGDHGVIRPLQGRSNRKIDWVIQGCESGHGRRYFATTWARFMRDQCRNAGTAYFLKQIPVGDKHRVSGDESEWPEDLRGCRAWPRTEGRA